MNPVVWALAVLALAGLIGVLLLAQRLRRVEERLRAHDAALRDLEATRRRAAAAMARKQAEAERQAARH